SSDDGRTHRDWIAKPGRIKKCDFCEGRSTGIIHQCSKCPVLICQDCAIDGRWKGDITHYVDAQALNWEYPTNKKANNCFTGSQPIRRSRSKSVAPDAEGGAPVSDDANKTTGDGTKRKVHFATDEGSQNNVESVAQKRQRKSQSPTSSASSTQGHVSSNPELHAAHEDKRSFGKSPEDLPPSDENHDYMMTGGYFDPTRTLPPQPPNYAEDSFHNYPAGLAYVPTLRTTPIWSPMNDLSPEELRIMHDDRCLRDSIATAWQSDPVVLRVREYGIQAFNLSNWVGTGGGPGDYEALKLLWEVSLVRMGRVVLHSAPQTKRWFVDE
ncbi:hypothetical protein V8F33_011396, partial [Rhypophila sp. PSN 637]